MPYSRTLPLDGSYGHRLDSTSSTCFVHKLSYHPLHNDESYLIPLCFGDRGESDSLPGIMLLDAYRLYC